MGRARYMFCELVFFQNYWTENYNVSIQKSDKTTYLKWILLSFEKLSNQTIVIYIVNSIMIAEIVLFGFYLFTDCNHLLRLNGLRGCQRIFS